MHIWFSNYQTAPQQAKKKKNCSWDGNNFEAQAIITATEKETEKSLKTTHSPLKGDSLRKFHI